ncbi:MAG: hypothetical protein JST19_00630 [Bacteroidetes bacterium]|nr:hypothetical protein [Bacteroidota bacterium]
MKPNYLLKASAILAGVLLLSACHKEQLTKAQGVKMPVSKARNLNSSSAYYNNAEQTHNFIVGNILSSYFSCRGNTTTEANSAYEWYNTSQIYADAAAVSPTYGNDGRFRSWMDSTYNWMYHMWDFGSSIGGYFSAANLDGSGAGGDKYVDDAGVTINAYLDAYAVTSGTTRSNYLASAQSVANWMMNSGLWDSTDGGGFYQRTGTGAVKPTQTNGLAVQAFLRLYQITGQSYYKSWAQSVMTWLEGNLYDSASGLYDWEFDASGVKQTAHFTYDNAIMVEADLLYASVLSDNTYVTKAQNLGSAMNTTLWNSAHHVYIFNTTDQRVNPAWCVWGSQAMIRLYERDGNTAWLDYAQQNIDFINTNLRTTSNYGYHTFCDLNGGSVDTRYEGVDQAWMERTQFMLSAYR